MRPMRESVYTVRVASGAVQRAVHRTFIPIRINDYVVRPVTLHAGRALIDGMGRHTGSWQHRGEKKRSDGRSCHARPSNLNCPDHWHSDFQAFLHVRDEQ